MSERERDSWTPAGVVTGVSVAANTGHERGVLCKLALVDRRALVFLLPQSVAVYLLGDCIRLAARGELPPLAEADFQRLALAAPSLGAVDEDLQDAPERVVSCARLAKSEEAFALQTICRGWDRRSFDLSPELARFLAEYLHAVLHDSGRGPETPPSE